MTMSTVQYGSETMYGVVTTGVHQRIVRDSTNTDLLYHQFELRFQGLMHTSDETSIVGFSNQQDTLADGYVNLRRKMMQDRQLFIWKIGGSEALRVRAHPGGQGGDKVRWSDVDNGPKPQELTIKGVRAGHTIEVEFSIHVAIVDCDQLENSSGVLSNRWATIDMIDENWYTTRTFQGELVLASPKIHPQGPNFFRNWVFPPLSRGFKRESMEFTASQDGRKLLYTIRDRQTSNAPPKPATSWRGTHTVVSQNNQSGIGTTVTIDLTLTGPEGNDIKRQLFAAAAQVARDRIVYENATSGAILQEMRLVDVIEESRNEIQLSLRVFKPGSLISDLSVVDLQTIGKGIVVAGYNRFENQVPRVFGTATPTGALIAHLQSACDEDHRITDSESDLGGESSAGANPTQAAVEIRTYEGLGEFIEEGGPYQQSHLEKPYKFYRIEGKHCVDQGRVAIPIAKSDDDDSEETQCIARLHQPISRWLLKVAAERIGSPPDMPQPVDFSDGEIKYYIFDSKVFAPPPEVSSDGNKPLHQIQIEYQYEMSRPHKTGEKLRTGALPWDNRSTDENKIPAETFKDGIS